MEFENVTFKTKAICGKTSNLKTGPNANGDINQTQCVCHLK